MAITNAQQARQMYKRGTGLGGSGRGREDSQSQYGGGSYDSSANRSGREVGGGYGRNPTAQFSPEAQTIAREMRNTTMGAGDRFVPDFLPTTQKIANLFQVKKPTPFDLQRSGFVKAFQPKQTLFPEGGAGGVSGSLPLWAQLGFNSEAEYLASLQAKETTDQETKSEDIGLRYRFAAEGGIMNDDVIGGEMDFDSARQMYGLGKLVKKVTRSVKKIAKSPIGKAAIVAATYKLGGGKMFGGQGFKFSNLPGLGFLKPASSSIAAKAAAAGLSPRDFMMGMGGKTATGGGIFSMIPGGKIGAGILGLSALAGLTTPEEEEQDSEDTTYRGEGLNIADIRSRPFDFTAPRFMAEGGSTEKEPVAKKTMPLLDMDGKEMDLREEGGFVPIGRMEKADDVPARLSKNEFVFTADAVRNAGDGSVDKGAEVMYNMMKNLEAGGDVSEESQGLEGARKMFQTSQRLEEVL
jgi:hypothetical protein